MSRIICPPENWRNPIDVGDDAVSAFVEAAKRLGLVCRQVGDKLYLGQVDRAEPAASPTYPQGILLNVPYYSQRDSAVSGQAGRMCFSSTCAMAVKFLRPGALTSSANADDEYLQRVFQYGDTTDPQAQLKALAHLGVTGHYSQQMAWADVDAELAAGRPVAIGWLIWGPVSAPSGGGHWSLVVGKSGDHYRVHDPYGECDLANGGYLHSDGRARTYSAANLGRRWMVEGDGSGWGMTFRKEAS